MGPRPQTDDLVLRVPETEADRDIGQRRKGIPSGHPPGHGAAYGTSVIIHEFGRLRAEHRPEDLPYCDSPLGGVVEEPVVDLPEGHCLARMTTTS